MSQLTAHIVYATFQALSSEEKETFVRLIEEERQKVKQSKPKRKSVYDSLPAKYHPDNIEMLVAEIMHGG